MICQDKEQMAMVQREIRALRSVKGHPNIIALLDYSDNIPNDNDNDNEEKDNNKNNDKDKGTDHDNHHDNDHDGCYAASDVLLLFPLYLDGTLWDLVKRDTSSSGNHRGSSLQSNQHPLKDISGCLSVFLGICKGVQFLHSKGYVHRDIKPQNVLVVFEEKEREKGKDKEELRDEKGERRKDKDKEMILRPVVIDLGSCQPYRTCISNRRQALQVKERAEVFSSQAYRAPELYEPPSACVLDGKTDVWSLGCLLYCMIFGHGPFEDKDGLVLILAIYSGQFVIPSLITSSAFEISPNVITLIKGMLIPDMETRLSLTDVIQVVLHLVKDPNSREVLILRDISRAMKEMEVTASLFPVFSPGEKPIATNASSNCNSGDDDSNDPFLEIFTRKKSIHLENVEIERSLDDNDTFGEFAVATPIVVNAASHALESSHSMFLEVEGITESGVERQPAFSEEHHWEAQFDKIG